MTNLVQERIRNQSLQTTSMRAVFDLREKDASLFKNATKTVSSLSELVNWLSTSIPLPLNAMTSAEGPFYRLPNHHRSFCYALEANVELPSLFDSDVVVFKGTEPLMPDFERYLGWMSRSIIRSANLTVADHFPLAEGKSPGCVFLKEALHEAEIACEIQSKHYTSYGQLAPIPLPLFVHAFSEEENLRVIEQLKDHLSPPAFSQIEAASRDGFGVLIYYFPSSPIRADFYGSEERKFLKTRMKSLPDRDDAVRGWVRMMVRLLYMRYLPFTAWSEGRGSCLDYGNATIFGGLCDLDSVVPFEMVSDDAFFVQSVHKCETSVRNSTERLLGLFGKMAPDQLTRPLVTRLIHEAFASESRPGLELAPLIRRAFNPANLLDIVNMLKKPETLKTDYVV